MKQTTTLSVLSGCDRCGKQLASHWCYCDLCLKELLFKRQRFEERQASNK